MYLDYFVNQKGCKFDICVWCKTNTMPFTNGGFLKDREFCLYFAEDGITQNTCDYSHKHGFWVSSTNQSDASKYEHPTIKPLNIIEQLVMLSSNEGDLVLDPFLGSGTTALACKHQNRNFIGWEIYEPYYKIAVDRVNGLDQKGHMNLFDL